MLLHRVAKRIFAILIITTIIVIIITIFSAIHTTIGIIFIEGRA
jgi:hypothetical protein